MTFWWIVGVVDVFFAAKGNVDITNEQEKHLVGGFNPFEKY